MRKLASPLESEQMEMAIPDVDGNGVALPDVRTGKRPYGRIEKKDERKIIEGIRAFKPLYIIAKELGVNRHTLYRYLREKMDVCYRDMRESMIDVAENRLFRNIIDGNQNAIQYFLDKQGKSRGYGEQKQNDRNDIPIINIGKIEVSNGDAKPEPIDAEAVEVKYEEE